MTALVNDNACQYHVISLPVPVPPQFLKTFGNKLMCSALSGYICKLNEEKYAFSEVI